MTAIPFPLSSSPGPAGRPQEGAGRLVNCFAEKQPEGAPDQVIWRRTPGLRQMTAISDHSHCRGMHVASPSLVLIVLDNRVYSIESSFTANPLNLGALSGSAPVTIAKNNVTPVAQIVCTAENGSFVLTSSSVSSYPDPDLPIANSVSMLDGYFLFTIGDGRIFASALNSLDIATNSFTTAQKRGDGLLRGVVYRDEFFAFGQSSCEVYRNVGTSPFPLAYVTMIPRGIVGTHAVAGWEEGWSNELLWVADDNAVYQLVGYTPTPISTHEVSRTIERTPRRSLIECHIASTAGHPWFTMTSPGEWTWTYDMSTKQWHEAESYLSPFWRASRSVKAFNRWLIGDRKTGQIFALDETWHRDGTIDAHVMTIESASPPTFPSRASVPRADFHFTAGTGIATGEDPIEVEPRVMIAWSNDGGQTYKTPLHRQLGRQGEFKRTVAVRRTGAAGAHGRRWRLQISDPVPIGFTGGQMAIEGRAE